MRPYSRLVCRLARLGCFAVALVGASCTDPVRDRAIQLLGTEVGGGPGPEHRPGEPCVLCHSAGGPASAQKFAVGGTVFQTPDAKSMGAAGVRVLFIDAASSQREAVTNAVGNFFVREEDWPDLTFPFRVGLVADKKAIPMTTTVNREGSCNECHAPNANSSLAFASQDPRASVGQIYVGAAK